MAPFKSSETRSSGKLFGVFKQNDLSLRGSSQSSRVPPPPTVTGGTITTPGDGYKYHFFTSSQEFIVSGYSNLSIEYLIVGGGGGGGIGGFAGSGGGGAGGFVPGSTTVSGPVIGNPYTITVGDGGTGNTNGSPSTAFGKTAYGGGAGDDTAGEPGGSGGGGTSYSAFVGGYGLNPSTPARVIASFPQYVPGTTQGYPGGTGAGGSAAGYGGGGGGAGQAGSPGPSLATGGNGLAAFS